MSTDRAAEFGQRPFSAPPGATEILLVRHGQSASYVDGEPFDLVDGHGDPPLSDHGHSQALRIADRLQHEQIDAIYVTTLQRTHQTIAPLASRIGITPIVEPDLREVHLGEWEGGLYRRMAAERHPAFVEMDRTQDWGAVPGGESSPELRTRVRRGIERVHAVHPDQRIVVVSHGGAIGAVLAEATGARSLAFASADNASISHLVIIGDRWIVRRFNDTSHLGGDLSVQAESPT
jgi:2,3-bisphosphoglycerate-dependent phosphoglycerate mutase